MKTYASIKSEKPLKKKVHYMRSLKVNFKHEAEH